MHAILYVIHVIFVIYFSINLRIGMAHIFPLYCTHINVIKNQHFNKKFKLEIISLNRLLQQYPPQRPHVACRFM